MTTTLTIGGVDVTEYIQDRSLSCSLNKFQVTLVGYTAAALDDAVTLTGWIDPLNLDWSGTVTGISKVAYSGPGAETYYSITGENDDALTEAPDVDWTSGVDSWGNIVGNSTSNLFDGNDATYNSILQGGTPGYWATATPLTVREIRVKWAHTAQSHEFYIEACPSDDAADAYLPAALGGGAGSTLDPLGTWVTVIHAYNGTGGPGGTTAYDDADGTTHTVNWSSGYFTSDFTFDVGSGVTSRLWRFRIPSGKGNSDIGTINATAGTPALTGPHLRDDLTGSGTASSWKKLTINETYRDGTSEVRAVVETHQGGWRPGMVAYLTATEHGLSEEVVTVMDVTTTWPTAGAPLYTVDLGFGDFATATTGAAGGGPLTRPTLKNEVGNIAQTTLDAAFATPSLTLGTSSSAGTGSSIIRHNATILAFDATVPSTQAFGDSASAGSASVAARRDHKHAMPAAPAAQDAEDVPFDATGLDNTAATDVQGALEDFDAAITAASGGTPAFVGCKVYSAATQTINNTSAAVVLGSEEYDTSGFHFTATGALTGTVSKTSGSPNITGSGTSFTTELSVNQVITIPGTATEYAVVKSITDNTNLVVWANMANTASGQTATRINSPVAIPAGKGGKYTLKGGSFSSASGWTWIGFRKNGTTNIRGYSGPDSSRATYFAHGGTDVELAEGDFVEMLINTTANINLGHATLPDAQSWFAATLLGV